MYMCYRCGKLYEELPEPLRCSACAGRIFLKVRQEWVRRVKTR